MTHDEQVAALTTRLTEVTNSIAQLNTALAAAGFDQRQQILSQIAQLQQTADTLRMMLNNLATAAPPSLPMAAASPAARAVQTQNKAMIKSATSNGHESLKRANDTKSTINNHRVVVGEPVIDTQASSGVKKKKTNAAKKTMKAH